MAEVGNITEEDMGVKTYKRKVAEGLKERFSHFEKQKTYALPTIVDPRWIFIYHQFPSPQKNKIKSG